MIIPQEILEQVIMYCQGNGYAVAQIGSPEAGITMIIMGKSSLSPDQASIIAAHMLLTGVITGGFAEINKQRKEELKNHDPTVN